MPIRVEEHQSQNGPRIVTLIGDLDNDTAWEVEQELVKRLSDGHTQLMVDLKPLARVTSAGLRVLMLQAKQHKTAGGRLVFFGLSKEVEQVFQMTGLLAILGVASTEKEAVEILTGDAGAGF